jgi:hypothetical protein
MSDQSMLVVQGVSRASLASIRRAAVMRHGRDGCKPTGEVTTRRGSAVGRADGDKQLWVVLLAGPDLKSQIAMEWTPDQRHLVATWLATARKIVY